MESRRRLRLIRLITLFIGCLTPVVWVVSVRVSAMNEARAIREAKMLHAAVQHEVKDDNPWTRIQSLVAGGPLPSRVELRFEEIDVNEVVRGPYGRDGDEVQLHDWNDDNLKTLRPILKQLPGLETLSFRDSPLPGGMLFRVLPKCPNLQHLSLAGTEIDQSDLAALERAPELTTLDLSGTPIADEDLAVLARFQLQQLGLNNTSITATGLKQLADQKNLRQLDIGSTQVEATAIDLIASWNVKELVVVPSNWTIDDIERLRSQLPEGCRVICNREELVNHAQRTGSELVGTIH